MDEDKISSETVALWYKICRNACVEWEDAQTKEEKMGSSGSVINHSCYFVNPAT